MNILIDTHIFIWWLKDDKQLTKKARDFIKNANEAYVSSASIWEAGIKIHLGKLDADINKIANGIEDYGFIELPITAKHAAFITKLPNHHRDPFDRMLLAQAMLEPLRFITCDKTLKIYSDLVEIA